MVYSCLILPCIQKFFINNDLLFLFYIQGINRELSRNNF